MLDNRNRCKVYYRTIVLLSCRIKSNMYHSIMMKNKKKKKNLIYVNISYIRKPCNDIDGHQYAQFACTLVHPHNRHTRTPQDYTLCLHSPITDSRSYAIMIDLPAWLMTGDLQKVTSMDFRARSARIANSRWLDCMEMP